MEKSVHRLFGFDEGVFTPGSCLFPKNPNTDFVLTDVTGKKKIRINKDTGEEVSSYAQTSWYWKPSVALMNHPSVPKATEEQQVTYWPVSEADKKNYGINTYSPDVEPGFDLTKKGEQDILVIIADAGGHYRIPEDSEIHGESLWPYLTTGKKDHRDWIYAYRGGMQLVRRKHVLKDGNDKWWNVSDDPDDLISFDPIKDWEKTPETHRKERDLLNEVLPRFDNHDTEPDYIQKQLGEGLFQWLEKPFPIPLKWA